MLGERDRECGFQETKKNGMGLGNYELLENTLKIMIFVLIFDKFELINSIINEVQNEIIKSIFVPFVCHGEAQRSRMVKYF